MSWRRRDFIKTAGAALLAGSPLASGAEKPLPSGERFYSAKPLWPRGRTREKNLLVGFRCEFALPPTVDRILLRCACSSLYRAYLNGRFCAHGPARGPHGWFRIDEWDLSSLTASGLNILAIEVAGYNVNSY